MNIDTIKEGYVIDHIEQGKALEIYHALELNKYDVGVAIITNVKSHKLKRKDILKIDKVIDIDFNKLIFIDKNLTINTIKKDKVIDKRKLTLPEEIRNIKICKNPRCITTIERNLDQIFVLSNKERAIYKCAYCEQES